MITVTGGFAGIWSETEGSGFAETLTSNFEGQRGRIHLGTTYTLENGIILSAGADYDGIGTDDYESVGVHFGFEMKF
ncbi:MAG: hypothetical protein ABJN22_03385 [Litorimonas sp.]